MIPKKIHYCWFGGAPKTKLGMKCIKSWKKYCPDYEIIEWNEDNFDFSEAPLYVRQAYEAKKWAFVTDYVRLKVVYDNGGIYMDTDVKLKKILDPLLTNSAYFGFEDNAHINTGHGFGAEAGLPILKELIDDYTGVSFINEDGSFDTLPSPPRNTPIFIRHGLVADNTKQVLDGNMLILPRDHLCPIGFDGSDHFSKNTISVHLFEGTWLTPEKKRNNEKNRKRKKRVDAVHYITHIPNRVIRSLLGRDRYESFKRKMKG